MKYKKNIHCFISPMLNESRVMKETSSLIKLGLVSEIKILGYWESGLSLNEKIDKNTEIVRLTSLIKKINLKKSLFRKVVIFFSFLELNAKYLIQILIYKPDFISCHNLILLPVCVLGKKLTGSKMIYDTHELETEKTGLSGLFKRVSIYIERKLFKYVDKTIVVCDPIAEWYKLTYNSSNVYVLRNVPNNPFIDKPLIKSQKLRNEFCIPESDIIFIYQGIIDRARGCKEILDIFTRVSDNRHIIMMGFGDMEKEVLELSKIYTNIHFKSAVPINKIIDYSSSADVGLFFLPFDISLSYRYSLPNKFFEYLMGGLPVVVSDNLEYLSHEIRKNNLGWVLGGKQDNLKEFITSITFEEIRSKNTKNYADKVGWQIEHYILKKVYI